MTPTLQASSKKVQSTAQCTIQQEHVDGYKHLNNSMYPLYFEQGRIAIQERLGIPDEALRERGLGFLVRTSRYTFITPAHAGEEVIIASSVLPYLRQKPAEARKNSLVTLPFDLLQIILRLPRIYQPGISRGLRIRIQHAMYKADGDDIKPLATAQTTHVFVNLKSGKPIRPLDEVVEQIAF